MNWLDGYRTFIISLVMGTGFLWSATDIAVAAISSGLDLTATVFILGAIAGGILTVTGPAAYKSVRTTQALRGSKK